MHYPIIWLQKAQNIIKSENYQIYLSKPLYPFQGLYLQKYKTLDFSDSTNIRLQYYIYLQIQSNSSCYNQIKKISEIAEDFKNKADIINPNIITYFQSFILNYKEEEEYIGELIIKLVVNKNIDKNIIEENICFKQE